MKGKINPYRKISEFSITNKYSFEWEHPIYILKQNNFFSDSNVLTILNIGSTTNKFYIGVTVAFCSPNY